MTTVVTVAVVVCVFGAGAIFGVGLAVAYADIRAGIR